MKMFPREILAVEVKKVILSYLRSIILYLLLILTVRLMGKRQIGEMEPAEFVVTMLLANLASIPMQDGSIPLFSGLVPIFTVLCLELVLSGLALRSIFVRRLLCGKPVILIENGRILQDQLRKTRMTLSELLGHLREKDVLQVQTIQYAILETNGELSVFPYPKDAPATAADAGIKAAEQHLPISIIEDGHIFGENLQLAGKDKRWLRKVLQEHDVSALDTFLMTVDGSGEILLIRREEAK